MPVTVAQLAIAPVKGMRLQRRTQIQLGRQGVRGDRDFLVVDQDCNLLQTARNPGLVRIEPPGNRPGTSWRCVSLTAAWSKTRPSPGPPRLPGCMTAGKYPDVSYPGR